MIPIPFDSTEVLATNFWFGSTLCDTFTAGTGALEKLCAQTGRVTRIEVDCVAPESTGHAIRHFHDYFDAFHRVRDHLSRRKPRHVVNVGGGCAAEIAVLPYLRSLRPDLHVVWIDAHFDLNLPSTSLSHYVHGMTVGVLTDPESYACFFDDPWHFDPQQFVFIGQKTSDPYERQLVEQNAVANVPASGVLTPALGAGLAKLKGHPVHIHLDLDVLRPELYPNPKCTIADGLGFEEISMVVSAIQNTSEVIGYTIAENPETEESKVREVAGIFMDLPR